MADYEKLTKCYDQMCVQMKLLKHDKDNLEQHYQQERQDTEGQLVNNLQRFVYIYILAANTQCCSGYYDMPTRNVVA